MSANKENLKIDFNIMDAENLAYKSKAFDLVYGIGILHHLNLNKVIPEIRRVLKPGGKAIFREPMGIIHLLIY
ncbi:MAG: class I SAM-dependent methyltransferase, partial [bacterium]